jgi:trimeric autotransporter adhesin
MLVMKRTLLMMLLTLTAGFAFSQTTYYWVGGTSPTTSITSGSNWNTALNGSGSPRPSATGTTDILVFDGTNVGGATPATGIVTVLANGAVTCGQIKFINNASVSLVRTSSGTTTIIISGEVTGDDFEIQAGSSVIFNSTAGSIRIAMVKTATITTTGRVNGSLSMITSLQARFDNTTSGIPGSFIFTSGSSFTTNITSASSSYAFGSSSQSSEKWVIFEAGSHLYYDGGYSPVGSGTGFSAIDMKPGSFWHHRASNATSGTGNFFNRKQYGNVIVENNATLTALGPVYRIENLTINAGSTYTTSGDGQTVVTGNLVVDGALTLNATVSNELILAGNSPQAVSGSGTINIGDFIIADNANVSLAKDISIDKSARVYGRLNFYTYKLTGNATFAAKGKVAPITGTGNVFVDSFMIKGNTGISVSSKGMGIAGPGIAPNTSIVGFSATGDTIFISHAGLSNGTGVSLSVAGNGAVLETANTSGFNPASGSVSLAGNQAFEDNINYIINGATTWPFGITTSSSPTAINADYIDINAPVTLNRGITIAEHLAVNEKTIINFPDIVHITSTATLNGTFGPTVYLATTADASTGDKAVLQIDNVNTSTVFPVGTTTHYLPVTISPVVASDFAVSVFEGITSNGTVSGTALTASQKLTVVDVVWNINRVAGSGDADVQLTWNAALEGATFTTLPDTDIGLIKNNGSSWDLPVGTGNNTTNTVTATLSNFGALSAGAVPQVQPFVFNSLPVKTYGDADFNGGATSLNTSQPIIYSSNNPAVATIVAGDIHITGAGTATITASQASDGFYPAASIAQPLTVNKATLEIKADDKLKFEGTANPPLTATYTGLVLGETPAVLLTQPVLTTTAVTSSPSGTYPITVSDATAANYDITQVNGVLTVQPKQTQAIAFNALPAKTYGNADFAAGATSTNNTIPVTYSSSNTNVATIAGGNIHITGAGTTTITASQAGNDGYFPATDVQRTLTVNKAALTVRVRDTTKIEGEPNPVFTLTYTGLVLGETPANLSTQPVAVTTATANSSAGYYTITPEEGISENYNFTYLAGRLTILPASGTDKQHIHAFQNTNGNLTVRVYSTAPAIADILVFDMAGRPVARRNLFMPVGFIQTEVFIPRLASGIYVVRIKGEGVNLRKTVHIIK